MKGDSSNTSGKQDFQKPSMTEIFEATIGDKRQDMRNKPQRFFAWYHPCTMRGGESAQLDANEGNRGAD